MTYRIRTWVGAQPLPNLDVTTGSWPVAIHECRDRAERYGWDDVSLLVTGQRALKGDELRDLIERAESQHLRA